MRARRQSLASLWSQDPCLNICTCFQISPVSGLELGGSWPAWIKPHDLHEYGGGYSAFPSPNSVSKEQHNNELKNAFLIIFLRVFCTFLMHFKLFLPLTLHPSHLPCLLYFFSLTISLSLVFLVHKMAALQNWVLSLYVVCLKKTCRLRQNFFLVCVLYSTRRGRR